jgi:hypothetical protein
MFKFIGERSLADEKAATLFTWYNNELGYVSTLIKHVEKVAGMM